MQTIKTSSSSSPLISPIFLHNMQRIFFSWIPQRYKFEGGGITPREFGQSLRIEEKIRFKGDKDRRHLEEIIKLYEGQLRESYEDPDFRIKT